MKEKGTFIINVSFDCGNVLTRLREFKKKALLAIEKGVEKSAATLLQDCRPYVPMLTGKLRDSGRLKHLQNYAFVLIWDAANPVNGYVYAERQYSEVFQHVDGRYAAKWVKKTVKNNPWRYSFLAEYYYKIELERLLGSVR